MPDRPSPRSSPEIFNNLRELAQRDGALHEISSMVYRDFLVTVDTKEGKVVDDPEDRWSTLKLNKNELMLLLGLTVQSETENTFSIVNSDGSFSELADKLLREFHDRLLTDIGIVLDPETQQIVEKEKRP